MYDKKLLGLIGLSHDEVNRLKDIMSQGIISEPDKWEAFDIYYRALDNYIKTEEFEKEFERWVDKKLSDMANISDIKLGDTSSFKFE